MYSLILNLVFLSIYCIIVPIFSYIGVMMHISFAKSDFGVLLYGAYGGLLLGIAGFILASKINQVLEDNV